MWRGSSDERQMLHEILLSNIKRPDLGEVRGPGQQQRIGQALLQVSHQPLQCTGSAPAGLGLLSAGTAASGTRVPLVRHQNGGRVEVGGVEAAMGRQPGC